MTHTLHCPNCKHDATILSDAAASCEPCNLQGGYRTFSIGPMWWPRLPGLRAEVGERVSVRNGSGEMWPHQLRRTNPTWGYGVVIAADERFLTVAFESPWFGDMQTRMERHLWVRA